MHGIMMEAQKQKNFEELREIRRSFGTLDQG